MTLRRFLTSLFRDPRTLVPALVLMALGVGGFAWMLALHRSVMTRSFAAPRPDRLVSLWNGMVSEPLQHGTPSPGDLQLMRQFPDVFSGVAAYYPGHAALGRELPAHVALDDVTGNYFDVLQVRPALGRSFTTADDAPGAAATVLLSHRAWGTHFGGDPSVVGRSLSLDGNPAEVIGVLPASFHTAHGTEVFRPFRWSVARSQSHQGNFLRVVARLQDGATLAQGQAAMDQVTARIKVLFAGEAPRDILDQIRYGLNPLVDDVLGQGLRVLRLLRWATLLVLLLAAYNAAALLLARSLGRRTEMAVRSALGADPAQLRRQLLAEGAVLGLLGAGAGLALAWFCLPPTSQALAWAFPELSWEGLSLDGAVVVASLALGPVLGALCALVGQPGASLSELLRSAGRQPGLAGPGRARRWLVSAQLLVGASLLLGAFSLQHSLGRLLSTDLGLDRAQVWTFRLQSRVKLDERTRLAQALAERLAALPGVVAAGASNGLPMSGFRSDLNLPAEDGRRVDPQARALTPGLVKALGLRLLRGRDVASTDTATSEKVVLVTRALALEAFHTDEVVGRRLVVDDEPRTVVGVLADVREFGPAQAPPPLFYLPMAQSGAVWHEDLCLAFRVAGPAPSPGQIQAVLKEAAPGLALANYQPMDALLQSQLGPQRMARAFMAAFAALALVLAAGGVFGIMAAAVAARRTEFGVRSALGATPLAILGQVLRETLKLALVASVTGWLLGLGLERLGRATLGALPEPPLYLGLFVVFALAVAALLAALLPALRAARIPPAEALRQD
ncbi:ABC transporter permease [Geothrix sp. PMB-07]|uniref:ABC transporter permease n=1 Tax=Geothrix sp. PMB-07 TaxID=3068640 RepID=UPI002741EBD5|nr:ABC transporter permease [Geothrix sp. PMB-07]WLT31881.1 ABC transporter permease [Geothrix sp. PMB-07]